MNIPGLVLGLSFLVAIIGIIILGQSKLTNLVGWGFIAVGIVLILMNT